ncbi:MAG: MFS superfamily sulfate permease-like transporter [Planctomycetota bacterium]
MLVLLRRSFQNSHFLHLSESDAGGQHKVRLRLAEEVTFLNKGAILHELSRVPDGASVTIDMGDCLHVDYDVHEIIEDFQTSATDRCIDVVIVPAGERVSRHSPLITKASA